MKIKAGWKWICDKVGYIIVIPFIFLGSSGLIDKIKVTCNIKLFGSDTVESINIFLASVGITIIVLLVIACCKVKKIKKWKSEEIKEKFKKLSIETDLKQELLQEPEKLWELMEKMGNNGISKAYNWILNYAFILLPIVFVFFIVVSNKENLNVILNIEPEFNAGGFFGGVMVFALCLFFYVIMVEYFMQIIEKIRYEAIKIIKEFLDKETLEVEQEIQNLDNIIEKTSRLLSEKEEKRKRNREIYIWSVLAAWAMIITFLIGKENVFSMLSYNSLNLLIVFVLCIAVWFYCLALVRSINFFIIEEDTTVWFLHQYLSICQASKRRLKARLPEWKESKRQEQLKQEMVALIAEDRKRKQVIR